MDGQVGASGTGERGTLILILMLMLMFALTRGDESAPV